jgi:hypothetical protein
MRAMAADGINLTNQFLIAMPGMADERFAGSVVYLCEHNDRARWAWSSTSRSTSTWASCSTRST